jgi:putative acetyltransferase
MNIRAEQPEDLAAIWNVNVAAFDRADEANLVDRLRGGVATFSFVAVKFDRIVGHIFFSPVEIIASSGTTSTDPMVLGLAPIAVLPTEQRQGIGSALIRHSLAECARYGCKAVVVLGNPGYYHRFGFAPASSQGLSCEYPVPEEAFMVLELELGALANRGGMVRYRSEFDDLE